MPGAVIEDGATVRYSIVAENAVIAKDAVVGGSPAGRRRGQVGRGRRG